MRESNVLRSVWLAVADTTVLFRLNTGKGWVTGGGKVRRTTTGDAIVPLARPVALGFGRPNGDPVVGAHDLAGFTSMVITPEMVGRKIAVITTIDAKESGGGEHRSDQITFMNMIKNAGGISGFASCDEEARKIISDFMRGH